MLGLLLRGVVFGAAMNLPPAGMYYEPRSYWSILNSTDGGVWNQDHFRNEGRYPITFTRFAISSVNQIFDWYPPGVANTVRRPYTFPDLLNRTTQQIRVPFRQNYTRTQATTGTFRPRPTSEPETYNFVNPPNFAQGTLAPRLGFGGKFQQSRLNFCHPLYLPQFGSIEVGLSSIGDFDFGGAANVLGDGAVAGPNDRDPLGLHASIAWFQEGGLFAGSARTKTTPVPLISTTPQLVYTTNEGWPYLLPVADLGGVRQPAAASAEQSFWPPEATFNATEFDRQEATRSGSTKLLGLSVAFDALTYFERIGEATSNQSGGIAPLAQRVGCQVRTTNGGSGDYWWRPGAPLSVVLDNITPAAVYDLDAPITLSPGDSLILDELVDAVVPAVGEFVDIKSLCISFNGFAAIEG